MAARRLYLGRLPPDTRSEDVSKFFDGYGHIVDCRVMTGFGFVEFESTRDAEDALNHFNGKPFNGANIVIEFAKESRPRRDVYEADRAPRPRARRPPGIRLIVSGVSRDTSWQDLKDFGREAGNVSYADIDRDHPGEGILEYLTREDADRAVRELDGKDLRGRQVRVALDDPRAGVDNYRRDDRRDDRDRGSDRRARSRSPPRYDDRRRSPPPRRDYDERRPAGSEGDRRAPREDYERRDDRRRDERYDERPPRTANGDGGWAR